MCFQTLAVVDDTVLEEHNEDPTLIQMHLIDDGGNILHVLSHMNGVMRKPVFKVSDQVRHKPGLYIRPQKLDG